MEVGWSIGLTKIQLEVFDDEEQVRRCAGNRSSSFLCTHGRDCWMWILCNGKSLHAIAASAAPHFYHAVVPPRMPACLPPCVRPASSGLPASLSPGV
jgi:hypothetical protein